MVNFPGMELVSCAQTAVAVTKNPAVNTAQTLAPLITLPSLIKSRVPKLRVPEFRPETPN